MSGPENIAPLLSGLPADVLEFADAAGAAAADAGTAAGLVGGIVRDMFLRRPLPPDADVIVEPPSVPVAESLARRFRAELIRHPRFHTFRLNLPSGRKFDIVTAREERYAAPAALPDVTPSTFEKDLSRRDFTINTMLCRLGPRRGELLDPFRGRTDLEKRVLRALHPRSFEDDPTRIFRAARFAGRLGFTVEPDTLGWIQSALKAGHPERLSPVRRRHELELILREDDPAPVLASLATWGALDVFCPGWNRTPPVVRHGGPAGEGFLLRLASVFGAAGADAAEAAMTRLAFEKAVKRDVVTALRRNP